eukprot:TRINITY_DN1727_c0_g1_i4.p1 TRINITY_DN1727_c0_g1~~TRINITY_DN1727_c0_g1_i4.p1  ORF type:complete len:357 (+),score=109.55 TRINITY_DN1727_c0_g1_i4:204-1274(+)
MLKHKKNRHEYGSSAIPLTDTMMEMSRMYESRGKTDPDLAVLAGALKQSSLFFKEHEKLMAKMSKQMAECFSAPMNNFVRLEVKEAMDAKDAVKGFKNEMKRAKKKGANVEADAKKRFDQSVQDADTLLYLCDQKFRIYFTEKILEMVEAHKTYSLLVAQSVEKVESEFAAYREHIDKKKSALRESHPKSCGSVFQGSSISKIPTPALKPAGAPDTLQHVGSTGHMQHPQMGSPQGGGQFQQQGGSGQFNPHASQQQHQQQQHQQQQQQHQQQQQQPPQTNPFGNTQQPQAGNTPQGWWQPTAQAPVQQGGSGQFNPNASQSPQPQQQQDWQQQQQGQPQQNWQQQQTWPQQQPPS